VVLVLVLGLVPGFGSRVCLEVWTSGRLESLGIVESLEMIKMVKSRDSRESRDGRESRDIIQRSEMLYPRYCTLRCSV